MTEKKTNMWIWDQVCKTDPKHTKKAEYGRRFTSIGAYYQIKQATKVFGPIGDGWWYDIDGINTLEELITCKLSLFYRKPDGTESKPIKVVSSAFKKMWNKKKNDYVTDDDAYKKVVTDCLTKAFSYLGFSADVFTGEFDGTDNKYAAQQQQASPGASKNKSQSSGPNTGPGATEKQRKAIWGISMNICGGDRDAAKKLVDDVCNNEGLDSGNLSMAHASVVIEKLHERNS